MTIRELMNSNLTNKQILNKLLGLHVGVHVGYYIWDQYISGSMWTISSNIPTLKWVKEVRKSIDDIDSLIKLGSFSENNWLDRPLHQQHNWMKSKAMCGLVTTMFREGAFY